MSCVVEIYYSIWESVHKQRASLSTLRRNLRYFYPVFILDTRSVLYTYLNTAYVYVYIFCRGYPPTDFAKIFEFIYFKLLLL